MDRNAALGVLTDGMADEARSHDLKDALRDAGRLVRVANDAPVPLASSRDMLAFMASGSSKLIATSADGSQQVVAFHFPGDLVSVPAIARYEYVLCAIEDCELLVFSHADLQPLGGDHVEVLTALLGKAITTLHRCRDNAVGLGRSSATLRVIGFLDDLRDRIGVRENGTVVIDLPMSRRDIADCLGLTVETISRQVSEMRRAGLIETPSRSRILLREQGALANLTAPLADAA